MHKYQSMIEAGFTPKPELINQTTTAVAQAWKAARELEEQKRLLTRSLPLDTPEQ